MQRSQRPVSLVEHVQLLPGAGDHVMAVGWVGAEPVLALADGRVRLMDSDRPRDLAVHGSVGLTAAAFGNARLVTGGGDGRVCEIVPGREPVELGRDARGNWIDALATHPSGAVAWSAGRHVVARDAKGQLRQMQTPKTANGLVFAPKGYRLAIAHYDRASLWFPNTQAEPEHLDWKGSHLDITWSPDGRFVVTSMQENALHGWRLSQRPAEKVAHMRMSGYPSKTRSFSWSHDGMWLATSGSDAVIIWPFQDEGPMGKAPRECGIRPARVTQVAFHPAAYVIAAGYEDGAIVLIRLTDASELIVRPAHRGSEITALGWDGAGKRLLFGAADGASGLLTLPT